MSGDPGWSAFKRKHGASLGRFRGGPPVSAAEKEENRRTALLLEEKWRASVHPEPYAGDPEYGWAGIGLGERALRQSDRCMGCGGEKPCGGCARRSIDGGE